MNLLVNDTLGLAILSLVGRLSSFQKLRVMELSVPCSEGCPFLGGSFIGGSTIFGIVTSHVVATHIHVHVITGTH